MNSNKGFVTIFMISAIPLILLISFCSFKFYYVLRKRSINLKSCRESVLMSQNILLDGRDKLFALNPQAKALLLAKKRLRALRLIPNQITQAVYRAAMLQIKSQQVALNLKQKNIIYLTNINAQNKLRQFRLQGGSGRFNINLPNLKVKKTHPSEISSPYIESLNFSEKQFTRVKFNYSHDDSWIKNLNNLIPKKIKINDTCISKPYRDKKWEARLD